MIPIAGQSKSGLESNVMSTPFFSLAEQLAAAAQMAEVQLIQDGPVEGGVGDVWWMGGVRVASPRLALPCPALSCLVFSCLVLSCLVLSCLVLPCVVSH